MADEKKPASSEKDPAKQTPDGKKTIPGRTPSSKQKTADSSTGKPGAKAASKPKPKDSGKSASSSESSKTTVQVSLDKVQTDVLDNLRDATSRHDYLQALVNGHLDGANPNTVFVEDDDLPGNERQLKQPVFRV